MRISFCNMMKFHLDDYNYCLLTLIINDAQFLTLHQSRIMLSSVAALSIRMRKFHLFMSLTATDISKNDIYSLYLTTCEMVP